MNVLMLAKGEYRLVCPKLAAVMTSDLGSQVHGIAFTTATHNILSRSGAFVSVRNLSGFLKKVVPGLSVDAAIEILRAEELADLPVALNTMIYADRIIRHYGYDAVLQVMAALVLFWREVFSDLQLDLVVGEVASAAEWVAWCIARRHGVRYLIPYNLPMPNRFFLLETPDGLWDAARQIYDQYRKFGVPESERRDAEEFIQTFRKGRVRSAVHKFGFGSPLALDVPKLLRRFGRIPARVGVYLKDGKYEVGSYDGTPPWNPLIVDTLRLLRYIVTERTSFRHDLPAGKWAYFALHMQPEFTTDVRAPFLTDQIALIENIARSLPPGYRLVVKEHPAMKGMRPLHYYRRLREMYNVHLVSPTLDSHELIQACELALTITGSTAWEGILYGKPVIAFGPVSYGFHEHIYSCNHITHLRGILREALDGHREDPEALVRFVAAVRRSARPGYIANPLVLPPVLSEANLKNVAQAIQYMCSQDATVAAV